MEPAGGLRGAKPIPTVTPGIIVLLTGDRVDDGAGLLRVLGTPRAGQRRAAVLVAPRTGLRADPHRRHRRAAPRAATLAASILQEQATWRARSIPAARPEFPVAAEAREQPFQSPGRAALSRMPAQSRTARAGGAPARSACRGGEL